MRGFILVLIAFQPPSKSAQGLITKGERTVRKKMGTEAEEPLELPGYQRGSKAIKRRD